MNYQPSNNNTNHYSSHKESSTVRTLLKEAHEKRALFNASLQKLDQTFSNRRTVREVNPTAERAEDSVRYYAGPTVPREELPLKPLDPKLLLYTALPLVAAGVVSYCAMRFTRSKRGGSLKRFFADSTSSMVSNVKKTIEEALPSLESVGREPLKHENISESPSFGTLALQLGTPIVAEMVRGYFKRLLHEARASDNSK